MRHFAYAATIVILLAGAYLLWTWHHGEPVTGYIAGQRQTDLARELETMPTPESCERWRPKVGEPWGRISIPKLDVHAVVVQGAEEDQLSHGPGHYTDTGQPCSPRSTAIAAHRTTWGAWFRHVDKLKPGDVIRLKVAGRAYTYEVVKTRSVDPAATHLLDGPAGELLLTTCDPPYDDTRRLLVFARMQS